MTMVVTENCELCRYTECVKVCPVACFHGDDRMLYIDADTCIDCCACIPACPMQAIYQDSDLPPALQKWAQINRERAQALPQITKSSRPLETAAAKRVTLRL